MSQATIDNLSVALRNATEAQVRAERERDAARIGEKAALASKAEAEDKARRAHERADANNAIADKTLKEVAQLKHETVAQGAEITRLRELVAKLEAANATLADAEPRPDLCASIDRAIEVLEDHTFGGLVQKPWQEVLDILTAARGRVEVADLPIDHAYTNTHSGITRIRVPKAAFRGGAA